MLKFRKQICAGRILVVILQSLIKQQKNRTILKLQF
nr:MAG TPA: hypothetical protein [Caudoviricetes sp.]